MNKIIKSIKSKYNLFSENYYKRQEILYKNGILNYLFNTKGYVLVIVLIVTSMLVAVSGEFLIMAQTNIKYIKKFREQQNAYVIAKSGINLGRFILEADKRGLSLGNMMQKSSRNIDSYQDLWAMKFPEIPIENGDLKIEIIDEQSKINLSVLSTEFVDETKFYGMAKRLFFNLGLPMDLADIILDWVDIDDSRAPYGAETSDYYGSLDVPYNARNNAMDSFDDLFLLKDFTPEVIYGMGAAPEKEAGEEEAIIDNKGNGSADMSMLSLLGGGDEKDAPPPPEDEEVSTRIGRETSKRLSDYLRVHGDRTDHLKDLNKININTASYRVLSALTDNMGDDIVTEIIQTRMQQPFNNLSEISKHFEDQTVLKLLDVKSNLFQIVSTGRINDTRVKIVGIYDRLSRKFYYWSEQ